MTRKRRARKMRVARLSKSVTVVNRMYGLLVQAFDGARADQLELQRRLDKLEQRLGVRWVPDHHYDGEHVQAK